MVAKYVIFTLFVICVVTRGYTFWKGHDHGPVAILSSAGALGFGIASCVAMDGIWK